MLIEPAPFHSMVQDFEMFCGTAAYDAAWVATIQFIGVLVGAIVYGHLGDYFGRKPVSLFGITVGIGFGVASGFAPTWQLFAVFLFICGTSVACVLIVFYAYILEFIEAEQRVFLRTFFNWGYARLIFTLVCFLCGYWRSTAIVTSLLALPVLPVILVLPESPKWYLTKNRVREAREAQKRVAWLSGVPYDIEEVDEQGEEKPETETKVQDTKIYTIRDLFASRAIAQKTIVVGSLWFSTSLSSFGADLNSGNLDGNFYMSQFVSAAAIALSKISIFLLDTYWPSFDRRRLHQFPQIVMIACYTAIMVLMVTPSADCAGQGSRNLAIIIINIIGASFIELTWDACYLVAAEIFPTRIRTIGIGTCSLLARIGALLAPQMAYLSDIYRPAPYAVVCSIGVISLLISCFFLPNTKGRDLADSEEEGKIGKVEA
uniref:MFS domain-containing protein n=1 Tax=Caenorhabditis japonica TaxID=281687 RepID=A0A8R1I8Y0_CAEJA